MKFKITHLATRVCYDSRGNETVEVEAKVNGSLGRAAAPAGASVGRHEAVAFMKGGAKATAQHIASYTKQLLALNPTDPRQLTDALRSLDGTPNYSHIGGSSAYALSLAIVEAMARASGHPLFRILKEKSPYRLPYPLGNVLGGGKHAGRGAPDIQEFLVCAVGAKSIRDAVAANIAVHKEVRNQIELREPDFAGGKGDEGAWAPHATDDEAFEIVYSAVAAVTEKLGFDIRMGVDLAASSLWDDKAQAYLYSRSGAKRTIDEQLDFVVDVAKRYRLIYLEDPVHEEDFEGFAKLTRRLTNAYVVGDDLFVTNPQRLEAGAKVQAGNAAILKVNQAGTLGDALRFAQAARKLRYSLITSHRSGETTDSHIAHVAIATGSVMLKTGVVGGERVAKLNELLRISERLRNPQMAPLPYS